MVSVIYILLDVYYDRVHNWKFKPVTEYKSMIWLSLVCQETWTSELVTDKKCMENGIFTKGICAERQATHDQQTKMTNRHITVKKTPHTEIFIRPTILWKTFLCNMHLYK